MRAPPGDEEYAPGSDVDNSDEETGDMSGRDVFAERPERSESAYY